jgi:hypothetical protein
VVLYLLGSRGSRGFRQGRLKENWKKNELLRNLPLTGETHIVVDEATRRHDGTDHTSTSWTTAHVGRGLQTHERCGLMKPFYSAHEDTGTNMTK